ncbi:hypothetical protein ABFS82_07G042600 [Erythranthe guttata]
MAFKFALNIINEIEKNLNHETFCQFTAILEEFGTRMIPSSYAVVAINRLLQNHPDLLIGFEPFVPASYSPAAAVAAADEADSLDFLDRVSEIFGTGGDNNNGGVYREFLDSMASYSKGEYTVSQVREKVVRLFGEKCPDLTAEFISFFPELESESETESGSGSGSSNLKSAADIDFGGKIRVPGADIDFGGKIRVPGADNDFGGKIRVPGRRKRGRREGGVDDDDKVTGRSPKKVKVNFELLEDSLCYVDVQISRLGSTYETAVKIARRIIDGGLTQSDVRTEEEFTPLHMACVREVCKEARLNEGNILSKIPLLLNLLKKKKEALEKTRCRFVMKMKHYHNHS